MHRGLGDVGDLSLCFDLERAATTRYDRTTAYLIDRQGIVREIFPMTIRARPSGRVILSAAAALEAEQRATEGMQVEAEQS